MEVTINKREFTRFKNLKQSGRVDMICIGFISSCTWMGKDKILEIIKNYDKYAKKYLK